MNLKLIAIKLGEGLKNDTTINEINRIASAVFDFSITEYPHNSITSTRSQLIYSWVMTLANQPMSDEEKNQILKDFIEGLTSNKNPLRDLIDDGREKTSPEIQDPIVNPGNKTKIIQLIHEGENFLQIMKKIDSGDKSVRLHQYEIRQWLRDVNSWASTENVIIPEPGDIFDLFVWDRLVLGYVSRVTHLLKSFTKNERNGNKFEYDIALSFAGEDRKYADDLAKCLTQNNIKVFYDKYEIADLWGKDLYEHLAEVYQDAAKFCVMFVSKNYAEKLWTNHERKNAQARAFKDKQEYILPIKLDDTTIAGLPDTTAYIDIRDTSIDEICKLLIEKLKRTDSE